MTMFSGACSIENVIPECGGKCHRTNPKVGLSLCTAERDVPETSPRSHSAGMLTKIVSSLLCTIRRSASPLRVVYSKRRDRGFVCSMPISTVPCRRVARTNGDCSMVCTAIPKINARAPTERMMCERGDTIRREILRHVF